MDGRSLAVALAERLQAVLPSEYLVEARDGLVQISRRDGTSDRGSTGVAQIVDQPGDPLPHLLSACYSTLDLAQDIVVEDCAEPWPGTVPTVPMVDSRGARIQLSYGTGTQTVLELRPIDLGQAPS